MTLPNKTCVTCGERFYLDVSGNDECWWCRALRLAKDPEPEEPPEADPSDKWKPARDIA